MTWEEAPYHEVACGTDKGRRYHARLRDHYQRIHDAIKAANVFCASGAALAFFNATPAIGALFSAIVALGSLLDLVFGFDKKARLHHDLCGRFTDLAAELAKTPCTLENLAKMRAKRQRVEKDEPSVKRLVELWAHNENARARGIRAEKLIPLTAWQQRLGCFSTFGMSRLEKWNSGRAENQV